MNELPNPTNYGEENYIRSCYGNMSDIRMHIVEKDGLQLECFISEVDCMLKDGFKYIGPKKK